MTLPHLGIKVIYKMSGALSLQSPWHSEWGEPDLANENGTPSWTPISDKTVRTFVVKVWPEYCQALFLAGTPLWTEQGGPGRPPRAGGMAAFPDAGAGHAGARGARAGIAAVGFQRLLCSLTTRHT